MPVTSPTSESGRAGPNWRRPSTWPAAGSWAGPWPITCAPCWSKTRSPWPLPTEHPKRVSFFTRTAAVKANSIGQYTSRDFAELARANGVVLSVGRKGECWDCEKNGDVVGSGLTLATTGRSCLCVDLSTRPAGVHPELLAGREGSDRIGACCETDPSQSCPPSRPAGMRRHPREERHDQHRITDTTAARDYRGRHPQAHSRRRGHRSARRAAGRPVGQRRHRRLLPPRGVGPNFGKVDSFGIEGTGSYGTGLTSFLRRCGHRIIEVNRGDRRTRRQNGKSDTLDAETAARSVLSGTATSVPKSADGLAEMIRQIKIARDTARKGRTSAIITLKQIIVNAPAELRETFDGLGDRP